MNRIVKKTSVFLLATCVSALAMAQNNAIFKGGNADGWSANNYQQSSSGNIFKGGSGDGWDTKIYSQSTTNIFKGGTGDGWDAKNYVQLSSSIFKGGSGDGWDSKNYAQFSKGIFTGGIGDGWASTYLPQGPVPVNFLYFNARKQGENASVLNWKTAQEVNSSYFDIERSTDALNFIFIGKVNAAGNSQLPVIYYFTDYQPAPELNYYRLKQVDIDGHFIYTPTRLVRFDDVKAGDVKYFPNPSNGLLNIELTEFMLKESIVINISNAAGIILNQLKPGSNINPVLQLDFSRYPKGIYFVQVKTASTNSTERIVLQ